MKDFEYIVKLEVKKVWLAPTSVIGEVQRDLENNYLKYGADLFVKHGEERIVEAIHKIINFHKDS